MVQFYAYDEKDDDLCLSSMRSIDFVVSASHLQWFSLDTLYRHANTYRRESKNKGVQDM